MEGAKRKIHRLRNSISRRLSTTEVVSSNQQQHGARSYSTPGPDETKVHPDVDDELIGSEVVWSPVDGEEEREQSASMVNGVSGDGNVSGLAKLSKGFVEKKARILRDLDVPEGEYADKSPKGSVDEGVKEVMDLINGCVGWVTTSSCGGRVSVFVEGGNRDGVDAVDGVDGQTEDEDDEPSVEGVEALEDHGNEGVLGTKPVRTGPGGKGGGKWLYTSHDPIPAAPSTNEPTNYYTNLFGLEPLSISKSRSPFQPSPTTNKPQRLIHLSFSPLILHTLCATLPTTRPLLAAAINAGFRESGVQSLRALDDVDAGVMLGIRTAGLVFSTVVGVVIEDHETGKDVMQAVVGEEYLRMCAGVVNERFGWNERRKERLFREITRGREELEKPEEESKGDRRVRKREEGLKRQEMVNREKLESYGDQEAHRVDDGEHLENGSEGLER